jgi:hypothetical protein
MITDEMVSVALFRGKDPFARNFGHAWHPRLFGLHLRKPESCVPG